MATNQPGEVREVSLIISDQRNVAAEIERLVTNISKTAISKRTAKDGIAKEEALDALWKSFEANHVILAVDLPAAHPYWTGKLYEQMVNFIKDGRDKLSSWRSLSDNPPPKSSPVLESVDKTDKIIHSSDDAGNIKNPVGMNCSVTEQSATQPGAPGIAPGYPGGQFWQPYGQWYGSAMPGLPYPPYGGMFMQPGQMGGFNHGQGIVPFQMSGQGSAPAPVIGQGTFPAPVSGHGVSPAPPGGEAASTSHTAPEVDHDTMQGPGIQPNAQFVNPWQMSWPYPWPMHWQNADLQQHSKASAPKLEPLKVPVFGGQWQQWTPFIELFETTIDTNSNIAAVQKFQYLLNYLSGDAKKCISHIPVSSENYPVAMQTLRERYENKRKICQQYVAMILNLPKLYSKSAAGIENIITVLNTALNGVKKYNFDTSQWDPIILECVTTKLDSESRERFDESLENVLEVPTTECLLKFLQRRHQVLLNDNHDSRKQHPVNKRSAFAATTEANTKSAEGVSRLCVMCSADHALWKCDAFLKLSAQKKNHLVKAKGVCVKCLRKHNGNCVMLFKCKECKGQHNSLLHEGKQTVSHLATIDQQVILATALVKVRNEFGQYETLRALIDPGSQDSFITIDAVHALALPKTGTRHSVSGIGGSNGGKILGQVNLHLKANHPSVQQFSTEALVLKKLTSHLPPQRIEPEFLPKLPNNLLMADPNFAEPAQIDILLGARLYAEIVKDGILKYNNNQLLLQNTELGWILTGSVFERSQSFTTQCFISLSEFQEKVNQFWEIEDAPQLQDKTDKVDEYFRQSTTRNPDGRYVVRLPKKTDVYGRLGHSRNIAIARLINLEKSFARNPGMAADYRKFLKEYEELGHMTKVPAFAGPEDAAYYLPHHAVVKESSTTTKTRVVFNASAKTHTGLSLNSLLEPGSKLQLDLHQIILRWRKHKFVISGDIEKMFRQIVVAPEDRDLQRIMWRDHPTDPISEYQLNTVTYGTAPATYLAVRALLQLAEDDGEEFPRGKEVLQRDFYVDDFLGGADTEEEALAIQGEITGLLVKGGFNIRKWTSNSQRIIKDIPEELRETGDWLLNPDATVKTLGVVWNPQRDEFRIRVDMSDFHQTKLTKRGLLSNIATIFDPLGFLAPISFACKGWMQQLWLEKTDWDQLVSAEIEEKWTNLLEQLPLINKMAVPRWTQQRAGASCQIHGFCDASEKGYAAVVYSRIVDEEGRVHVNLLAAKTRIAPLKNKLTLPRLELAGATLLAELVRDTVKVLELQEEEIFYWCDSQIALAWIAKSPSTWACFVAHRVAIIQQTSVPTQWRYVNTKENPADVASRGCSPAVLENHPLWWNGPKWLKDTPETWPSAVDCSTDLEQKPVPRISHVAVVDPDGILDRVSSFFLLIRIVAWMLRFKGGVRRDDRITGPLRTMELQEARNVIIRLLQCWAFSAEIAALRDNRCLPHLNGLAPFMDEKGILRVGGRLRHSLHTQDAKNPILLPKNHALTKSIIRETHLRTLHGGAQLTLSVLRQNYWVIDGRSTVRAVIRGCVRCQRFAAAAVPQQMGDLPESRVTPAPAFFRTGVDYCGPFQYRASKGRGIKLTKGYVSVFVCFVTKAIHLELVSDLTTDAFLAALKRFTARRGLPKELHSDNGTNFRGASRMITQEFKEVIKQSTDAAASLLANDGVEWKFIPAGSPHLGGLWEAGVKSVKKHMKRVLDDTHLTYEEFSTVLCQIEACLNSRPLYPVSSDPNDLAALTPGHFLVTRPLVARPEPAVLDANPTKRWALLTSLHQSFWKRWSAEYLTHLQQRTKWKKSQENPMIGELVLLKDNTLPPSKWAMGRITELHRGDDQKVRLVTVRKGQTFVKQPMVNLISMSRSCPFISSNYLQLIG